MSDEDGSFEFNGMHKSRFEDDERRNDNENDDYIAHNNDNIYDGNFNDDAYGGDDDDKFSDKSTGDDDNDGDVANDNDNFDNDNDNGDEESDHRNGDDDDPIVSKTPAASFIILESTSTPPEKNCFKSQSSCDVFKEESASDNYRGDDADDDADDDNKLVSNHALDSKVHSDEKSWKESNSEKLELSKEKSQSSTERLRSPSIKFQEVSTYNNNNNNNNKNYKCETSQATFEVPKDERNKTIGGKMEGGKVENESNQATPPRMNRKKLADDWLAKINSCNTICDETKVRITPFTSNVRNVWKKREELLMKGSHFEESPAEKIDSDNKPKIVTRTPSYRSHGNSANIVSYTNTGVKTKLNLVGNYSSYQPSKDPYRGVDRYGLIKMINDLKERIIDLEDENKNFKNSSFQQRNESNMFEVNNSDVIED